MTDNSEVQAVALMQEADELLQGFDITWGDVAVIAGRPTRELRMLWRKRNVTHTAFASLDRFFTYLISVRGSNVSKLEAVFTAARMAQFVPREPVTKDVQPRE